MFDAGEGTQHQLLRCPSVSMSKIEKIFVTHLHGDHTFGLPGLMCSISMMWHPPDVKPITEANRFDYFSKASQYLEIYGPPQLALMLRTSLSLSGSNFGFQYRVHECISKGLVPSVASGEPYAPEAPLVVIPAADDGTFVVVPRTEDTPFVQAAPVEHRIFCVGYAITEPTTPGKLNMSKVTALGVPKGALLAQLKRGIPVSVGTGDDAKQILPSDVLEPAVQGRTALILGDTCDSHQCVRIGDGAAVLVHEATFDDANSALAVPRGHSTARMAGSFATQVHAQQLILTHFSARFPPPSKDPEPVQQLIREASLAFSGAVSAAEDFMLVDLARHRQ